MNHCHAALLSVLLLPVLLGSETPPSSARPTVAGDAARSLPPQFEPADDGGFRFDTGVLRGRLRAGGKSLGLTEVVHVPTGARLDRSNGLLSHYRVFTRGKRYGGGAWDWDGAAELSEDGSVMVRWPAEAERPFELRAVYRWLADNRIEVVTTVEARGALTGFESFLACYFDPAFDEAVVRVGAPGGEGRAIRQRATRDLGEWQMYPRDEAARRLIKDGRWTLEPHPVQWTFPAQFAGRMATAVRIAREPGLQARLQADRAGAFALATPYETEGHFSTYVSMFGLDLQPGEATSARVVLEFTASAREPKADNDGPVDHE